MKDVLILKLTRSKKKVSIGEKSFYRGSKISVSSCTGILEVAELDHPLAIF